MNSRKATVVTAILVAAILHRFDAPAAQAQMVPSPDSSTGGISVFGTSESLARPNCAEIEINVSGSGELFGDALLKFRESKRRLIEAFEALKLPNLEITERGLSLGNANQQQQMNMARMQAGAGAIKPRLDISTRLRLKITNIEERQPEEVLELIGKLLDAARDAGGDVGPSPADINLAMRYGQQVNMGVARFVLEHFQDVREKVYEAAVGDARARAQRLAKLNGLEVGEVLSINEIQVSGDQNAAPMQNYMAYPVNMFNPNAADTRAAGPRVSTDMLTDIPVQVRLHVRFAIRAAGAERSARADAP